MRKIDGTWVKRSHPIYKTLVASAGRPVFTSDYYIVDPTTGKVAAFVDWNDPNHLLVQSLSARQVVIPTADAAMNNRLCATFAGGQVYVSNRPAGYFHYVNAAVPFTNYLVCKPTAVAFMLWAEVAAATNVFYFAYNAAVQSNFARGGTNNTINHGTILANAPLAMEARANASVPTRAMKSNNAAEVVIGSVGGTAAVPATTLSLGARYDLSAGASSMTWRMLAMLGELTPGDRAVIADYIRSDVGITML